MAQEYQQQPYRFEIMRQSRPSSGLSAKDRGKCDRQFRADREHVQKILPRIKS